jgi:xanthine/CO dehydrogenase XdhC/CoxF family maturation factor
MLGSKTKIKKLLEDFRSNQISESSLQKIYAPIGINIKNETSSEIAVSIAV